MSLYFRFQINSISIVNCAARTFEMRLTAPDKSIAALKILLLIALAFFPLFLHLDRIPIQVFDEARPALNAYEMHKNGNYLVPLSGNKPPLLLWMQVIFFKLLGASALAVRLPSAIAAFLTALTIVFFAVKYFESYWFGFVAALILLTTQGYISIHATRTGDYDSLLTFFTTLYLLSFFLFVEQGDRKYLHLFFIGLALSVLTKSVQGLLFIPGIIIYLIVQKKIRGLIKDKWFHIDLLLCIAVISGYYLLREYLTPGYLRAVSHTDMAGRYFTALDNHNPGFMFYFNLLVDKGYANWYWLIPCGIAIGCCINNPQLKRMTLFSALAIVTYWLVISFSQTKLEWYTVPLLPLLALVSAIPVFWLFSLLRNSQVIIPQFRFNIIPFAFLFIVFLHPYEKIIDRVSKEYQHEQEFYNIGYFLKWAAGREHSIQNHYICYDGYNAHLLFYTNILNDRGQQVGFKDWHHLTAGDMIIASQQPVQEYIERSYPHEVVRSYLNIKVYKIQEAA